MSDATPSRTAAATGGGAEADARASTWRERHPLVRSWLSGRKAVIGIPYVWVLVFFMLPFLIVLKISVSEVEGVRFKDVLTFADGLLQLTIKLTVHIEITRY